MIFVLRLAHILAGAFWFGAFMFTARILGPAMKEAGPAASGPIMARLGKRIPMVMMPAAIITIVAGIWLLMIQSAGAPGLWMKSGPGRTYSMGGGLAILALILGTIINMPAARRMGAINEAAGKRGGPPSAEEAAELQRLMARLSMGSNMIMVLLVLATAAMAVARYVP